MTRTINNRNDIIDGRDIIARIEELESERANLETTAGEEWDDAMEDNGVGIKGYTDRDDYITNQIEHEMDPDDAEELETLNALVEELDNSSFKWRQGEVLIRESHFVDYCEELVKEIYDMPHDLPDYLVIDWDATANNLRAGYSEVDYGGRSYLIRSSKEFLEKTSPGT